MKTLVTRLVGKKASELSPDFKINCFKTVICYFNNQIQDGKTSAQEMLDWLKANTIQVEKIESDTIIIVWSSSNTVISPNKIEINGLDQAKAGYPFGLVMEHAAVFLDGVSIFQKASPKDEDKFEIIHFSKMVDANYGHFSWIRFSYHQFTRS